MQEVLCLPCSWQRPVVFFAPLVCTHYKNAYRLRAGEVIGGILEQVVVPTQRRIVLVEFSGRTKINVSYFAARASVSPNHHQQPLPAPRGFVSAMNFNAYIVAKRSSEEDVVPRGNGKDRHVYLWVVFLNRPALPILVIIGMSQPVEKVGRQRAS